MPDDYESGNGLQDGVDAELSDLLTGPSAMNMVHGAIALDLGPSCSAPSQASIDAARNDILAALWGGDF